MDREFLCVCVHAWMHLCEFPVERLIVWNIAPDKDVFPHSVKALTSLPYLWYCMLLCFYWQTLYCCWHTVHSESIKTPWLFLHFVTLQAYSKIDSMFFSPSSIYTQYPIMTKRKQVFRHFCNTEWRSSLRHCISVLEASLQTPWFESRLHHNRPWSGVP